MRISFPIFIVTADETGEPCFLASDDHSKLAWPLFDTFDAALDCGRSLEADAIVNEFINATNLLWFMEIYRPMNLAEIVFCDHSHDTSAQQKPLRVPAVDFFRDLKDQSNEERQFGNN